MARKPRRVLVTADTVGGVWTYAIDLIRALRPKGVEVILATMGAPLSAAQAHAAAQLSNLHLRESRYKLEWMHDPWGEVDEAGRWLLELERTLQPDVVHLNGYAHATVNFQAPVLVVCHSCVFSWWRAVRHADPPAQWAHYWQRVREGLEAADLVVAPSRAILRAILGCYTASCEGRVIYNGRAPDGFTPTAKQPFALGAGRLWDEAKNLPCLDRAAEHLPYPVYVAGPLRAPDGCVAGAQYAQLLGQLTPQQLSQWMSRAAVYALPARYEPFGLSVLEAAHAGCALVLGDIPSLRELWNGAAAFVSPGDPDELRAALLELLEQPLRRRRLSARALERATRFSLQQFADGYLAVYEELRSQRRRPTRAAARVEQEERA